MFTFILNGEYFEVLLSVLRIILKKFKCRVYSLTFNRKREAGNENDYGTPGGEDKERRLLQV